MRFEKSTLIAWAFLLGAIVAEVIGTSFLKMELSKPVIYANMTLFIALSYYLMGLSIKKIQVGIAYAVWELLGSVMIIFISLVIFKENLTQNQIYGVILAFIGIILINIGEKKEYKLDSALKSKDENPSHKSTTEA